MAKAQLELKLAKSVGDNKKFFFFYYVNRKKRTKENIGPILDGEGHLTDKDKLGGQLFLAKRRGKREGRAIGSSFGDV